MGTQIKTENVTKAYNDFKALNGLNLKVEAGEIYGFLGPNGAGKTTTILLLLNIIRPTSGRLFLFGQDVDGTDMDLRKRIGVVSEKQYFYKEMTAWEYLNFFGDLYQVRDKGRKINELLEELNLADAKYKTLGTFSRGMQQKMGFARAFLHDPDLLVLDEPISGLDPNGVKQVRDLIARSNKKGKTIFISSHLLSEVEKLCSKVGIINKGKLLAEEEMENLKRRLSDGVELQVELVKVDQKIVGKLSSLDFVREIKRYKKNKIKIKVDTDKDYRAVVSSTISSLGGVVLGIKVTEMSLEEAFITITSKNLSLLTSSQNNS